MFQKINGLAIPRLVDKLQSRPLTQPTLRALRRTDPGLEKTIRILVAKLASDNKDISRHAILVLALLRNEGIPAITPLERIVGSDNAEISSWAAHALWKIDPESLSLVPALPVLIETLENPETRYLNKQSVLSDLASIGADAKPAVSAIVTAIDRGDVGKVAGEAALKKIDPEVLAASSN